MLIIIMQFRLILPIFSTLWISVFCREWRLPLDKSQVNYHHQRICLNVKGVENCLKKDTEPGDPAELAKMFSVVGEVEDTHAEEHYVKMKASNGEVTDTKPLFLSNAPLPVRNDTSEVGPEKLEYEPSLAETLENNNNLNIPDKVGISNNPNYPEGENQNSNNPSYPKDGNKDVNNPNDPKDYNENSNNPNYSEDGNKDVNNPNDPTDHNENSNNPNYSEDGNKNVNNPNDPTDNNENSNNPNNPIDYSKNINYANLPVGENKNQNNPNIPKDVGINIAEGVNKNQNNPNYSKDDIVT